MELLLPTVVLISLFISYLLKKFLTIARVAAAVGILVGFVVVFQYTFNNSLQIDPTFRIISGVIIMIVIATIAIVFIIIPYLRSQNFGSQIQPRLKYAGNQIRIRCMEDQTNKRTFRYYDYFLTIKNTAHETKAKDCEGFVTIDENIDKHKMLWATSKYKIDVGHEELLRLFRITETWDNETLERKTITLSPQLYEPSAFSGGTEDIKISVKIQSENAECPAKAFETTVGDIIDKAH